MSWLLEIKTLVHNPLLQTNKNKLEKGLKNGILEYDNLEFIAKQKQICKSKDEEIERLKQENWDLEIERKKIFGLLRESSSFDAF